MRCRGLPVALLAACVLGCTGAPQPAGATVPQPPDIRLLDLDGAAFDPFDDEAAATVFLFVRADCPVSNRYAPEMERIVQRFSPSGVQFYIVYVNPRESVETIRAHLVEYSYTLTPARDPEHELVEATGARVTPEVAIFAAGHQVYRGRIDDRYIDFGNYRQQPARRDVIEVLDAVVAGRTVESRTTDAVGCYIADVRPPAGGED